MATETSLKPAHQPAPVQYIPIDRDLQNAHQIPKYCLDLAQILNQAPLFDGEGSVAKQSKVASLARWSDARICDIFNRNAIAVLGEKRGWHIHDFGCGADQLYDREGRNIPQGITLFLFARNDNTPCSLQELEASYNQILSKMRIGWVKANIEDHPNIFAKKDPKEFDLFIKKTGLMEESSLISLVASRLSISKKDLFCSDAWLSSEPGRRIFDGNPYLWIRKSALPNVVEKMGFQLGSKL